MLNGPIIVMGVSGCGKSTVARALAQRLGAQFLDADDFHPLANIEKMRQGIALTDEDRQGWLETLASKLLEGLASETFTVLACSALKESYRKTLRVGPEVRFLYLKGEFAVIEERIKARTGHFMKPGLLESQFRTLEEPVTGPGTDALTVNVQLPVESIVEQALDAWVRTRRPSTQTR